LNNSLLFHNLMMSLAHIMDRRGGDYACKLPYIRGGYRQGL